MSFQTCMHFFLLQTTKEDIFKLFLWLLTFIVKFKTFLKKNLLYFRRKKIIQV